MSIWSAQKSQGLIIDELFSSCRSGLKLSVLKDSDRLDEPSRIVGTAAKLPQDLPDARSPRPRRRA